MATTHTSTSAKTGENRTSSEETAAPQLIDSAVSVVISSSEQYPNLYDAKPVLGNFTEDPSAHLWCANALAKLVSTPDMPLGDFNDDIQAAIRFLLEREVARARKADAHATMKRAVSKRTQGAVANGDRGEA